MCDIMNQILFMMIYDSTVIGLWSQIYLIRRGQAVQNISISSHSLDPLITVADHELRVCQS